MLEINNLHKSFDKKEILHGVSLNVKDGEIFGFIGQNGAGKTTTIKSAVGILDFEEGTILINGINVKEHPLEAKKITAYLPDNPDLYENLSGIQYLNFIADVFEISSEQREARISEYGKELGIYDNLGDQIKSLSHGMKQKVAIVSAFMHDPKLLVLDEPFVGLDPIASHTMKEKLRQLCDKGGSVFFSSHVLEVVENLCDEIAILKSGSVILNGKTADLLAQSGTSLEELFLERAE
ncbi:MAG: ABC transporter ATP-binding protein [Erysipelotrichaceae bacterium]|jgi:ABC-2 type transport system ATP-binding protein|nr:ABC transporter ATP-binding protein [Erysipelotrichaceae bacterium]